MKTIFCAVVAIILAAQPLDAYLKFTLTGAGQTLTLKWGRMPVRWHAFDRGGGGVTASEFQATMARAFGTWEAVPSASIAFQFGGFTGAQPFDDDGLSVIGFQDEPGEERVLGATGFLVDTITGEIVEADVFFNSAFPWSTAAAGDPNRFDLESVALHEIGHFLGLGHSALGETQVTPDGSRRVLGSGAVMFPISFGRGITHDRELQPDDIAGVSDLYPDADFRATTGIARGRVTRNGRGVLGAHIVAFHPESGELIGGFSLNEQGEFEIAGLRPGPHILRVEPLDDGDVDSFFDVRNRIDLSFLVTYFSRFFIAPEGGQGEQAVVEVRPR